VVALVTSMPGSDSVVTSFVSQELGFRNLIDALFRSLVHPTEHYYEVFPVIPPFMRDLVFWGLFAGLCVKPIRAAGLILGTILLGSFFSLVSHEHIRHQGIFYLLMITLYWITVAEEGFTTSLRKKIHRWMVSIGLGGILVVHLFMGKALWHELNQEQSSVKRLAEYINQVSPDAILIPEPDYTIEEFPYYANNDIYFIREKKYAKLRQLTLHATFHLSLSELLEQAQILQAKREQQVLIVLGHFDLDNREDNEIEFPYAKTFSWTNQSLNGFLRLTEKVSEFKGANENENFEVYRLK
jgi:hypothetical protein